MKKGCVLGPEQSEGLVVGAMTLPHEGLKVELHGSEQGKKRRAAGERSAGVRRAPGGARPPKGPDKGAASLDSGAASSRGSAQSRAGGAEPAPRAERPGLLIRWIASDVSCV